MSSQWVMKPGQGIDTLERRDTTSPQPVLDQVLVRMRAASLNFRDLMLLEGWYPGDKPSTLVPLSDGAGEVIATGPHCTRFKVGDRVAGIFMQSWAGGELTDADLGSALGGAVDGVLTECRLFQESGLVGIPGSLSFEEGATLPCAAVTAWNALYGDRPVCPGDTVLIIGTGGVAMFALQFAIAAGARVIMTSSSDDKLKRVGRMGAHAGINYRQIENWGAEARRITSGIGVDLVVETGGPGTLAQSLVATRRGGSVQMIGVLSMGQIDPLSILTAGLRVRGLMVGSREMFVAMNKAIEFAGIQPVIDKTFAFDEVPDAYRYLKTGSHIGKVVISIN